MNSNQPPQDKKRILYGSKEIKTVLLCDRTTGENILVNYDDPRASDENYSNVENEVTN